MPMELFLNFHIISTILIIVVTLGVILFVIIKNRRSPKLTVPATVLSKRTIRQKKSSDTCYFVTFQFEGGDTKEFYMAHIDYRNVKEDDFGKLTFQGTRFIGFEKDKSYVPESKGLRVTDLFSWLPEKEISQKELEHIFVEFMNGRNISTYQVTFSMPEDVTDYVLDAQFYLSEEGRKVAYILKDGHVIAVVGYKE